MKSKTQIFHASSGSRRKIINAFIHVFALIFSIISIVFLYSLFSSPKLEGYKLSSKQVQVRQADTIDEQSSLAISIEHQDSSNPVIVGFYVNYDDSSYASLKRNLDRIDWLAPEWINLGTDAVGFYPDEKVFSLLSERQKKLPVLPLVQNYSNQVWNTQVLEEWLKSAERREKLVDSLLKVTEDNHFAGVVIDFEEVPSHLQGVLQDFMKSLSEKFHSKNLLVAQAVPFDNPDWDYRAYAERSDYLMLMAYDEHWSVSKPGPIASQQWFEKVLSKRLAELDPHKTIICIGNYGYDWSNRSREAKELSFQEAVLSARDSEAEIKFDSATMNPFFEFEEEDGSYHRVWFLDAVTAFNQTQKALAYKPFGFALWRLGSEDPSIWEVFGVNKTLKPDLEGMKRINYGYDIDFEGTGEILQVVAYPEEGRRNLKLNDKGEIINESYVKIPSGYVIKRTGDRPGLVALTFDDGPDPVWTPKILDILKAENVKATFFIVGANGEANPDLVRRIVEEGHDIGNHSFTHPNLGETPAKVVDLELNATQRLIQSLTGRGTILFRPPYFGDAEPQTSTEVEPIVEADRLGYITIGLHIDPADWKMPGADVIATRTIDAIMNPSEEEEKRGQVVLLHDSGGDRSQTVEALPKIIETLRSKGYQFVTVSELAGIPRDKALPPVAAEEKIVTDVDKIAFSGLWMIEKAVKYIFLLGISLGLLRFLILLSLSFSSKLIKRDLKKSVQPFVSVIVPAFNESKVISKNLKSLLKSDYPAFEIIVVDDGSTDDTFDVVRSQFQDEKRLSVYRIENSGKAEALNFGIKRAKGDILITLDADTIFMPNTIKELVKYFADERVGAVAGNAKIGNRLNLITNWQAIEYIASQNLERRALQVINAITVVPGAVGAWRRSALEQAGYFQSDTLAEDQDLTIRIRMLGYRIVYADKAIAYTEAPDTVRGLIRQRYRWAFGTLQCMWKHRKAFLNPKFGTLGLLAMPNTWIFQMMFPLVAPLMELAFLVSLIQCAFQFFAHSNEFSLSAFSTVAFYYGLFLLVDALSGLPAFLFEPSERKGLFLYFLTQRFGYRQLGYFVILKSIRSALEGVRVGWNKVERKATVLEIYESAS